MTQKFLWLDMEMTGLNPKKDRILELAAIVTQGKDFEEVERFEVLIEQSDEVIEQMKNSQIYEWKNGIRTPTGLSAYDLHDDNGLIDRLKNAATFEALAEEQFVDFIKEHFGETHAIIAGNSVHQDRRFIRAWWPKVEQMLHYRMLDVTAFKLVGSALGIEEYEKQESHRALDDILESIEELKHYIKKMSI